LYRYAPGAIVQSLVPNRMVGLYKLRLQLTHELESAWFQPLSLKRDILVSKFIFKLMGQLVPLPHARHGSGVLRWGLYKLKSVDP
jgi:hypothetical protein